MAMDRRTLADCLSVLPLPRDNSFADLLAALDSAAAELPRKPQPQRPAVAWPLPGFRLLKAA